MKQTRKEKTTTLFFAVDETGSIPTPCQLCRASTCYTERRKTKRDEIEIPFDGGRVLTPTASSHVFCY
jgi:hypothetical protein